MTQKEALKLAFPKDTPERVSIFLDENQVNTIQKKARAKLESSVLTYYVGQMTDGHTGMAFFDSHIVRTLPETVMTVLDQKGQVAFVEILAFNEPMDYLPAKRWLNFFQEKSLKDNLWVKRGLRNISGATLSTQAIAASVRRILAIYETAVKKR